MSKKKREERSKHKQKKTKAHVGKWRSSILTLLDEHPDRAFSLNQIIQKKDPAQEKRGHKKSRSVHR
jgi:hypothetical protein